MLPSSTSSPTSSKCRLVCRIYVHQEELTPSFSSVSLGGLLNAILALVSIDVSVNIKLSLVGLLASVVGLLKGLNFNILLNILAIL